MSMSVYQLRLEENPHRKHRHTDAHEYHEQKLHFQISSNPFLYIKIEQM